VSSIRNFKSGDIPQVAALWLRTWRNSERVPSDRFLAYFKKIYFENPWVEFDISSLIHEAVDGRINSLVGLIPRPMSLDGR